jgi:hypothetical protein
MKKNFPLIGFFISLIFGASHDLLGDKLIHLYRHTRDFYFVKQRDPSLEPLFDKLYKDLDGFLRGCWSSDAVGLLNALRERENRQLAHYVFGKILSFLLPNKWERFNIWKVHLSPRIISAVFFFKKSKSLIYNVCRNYSDVSKEILPIILSIQRQYLHHLKDDKAKMKIAKRWIEEYELVVHKEDFRDLDKFLKLFYYLKSEATACEGNIPKTGSDGFLIKSALHSLKIRCKLFYDVYWKELDDYKFTTLPKQLLFLIVIDRGKFMTFQFLNNPRMGDRLDFDIFNKDFEKIVGIFFQKSKKSLFVDGLDPFEKHLDFVEFLQHSIEPGGNTDNLSEKERWLIRVIFYLLTIIKWH